MGMTPPESVVSVFQESDNPLLLSGNISAIPRESGSSSINSIYT